MQIPGEEISYHPASIVDPSARLFTWQSELFREIHPDHEVRVRRRLADRAVGKLMEDGKLVHTVVSQHVTDASTLVLSHRRIPYVTYPVEWTSGMLRDAALLTLDVLSGLASGGLTLKDAHPWNVLFDGARPVFVDFGSIVDQGVDEAAILDEYTRYFLNPLRLMSRGQGHIARHLLSDIRNGVSNSDLRGPRPRRHRFAESAREVTIGALSPALRKRIQQGVSSVAPGSEARRESMRAEIAGLALPALKAKWSDYGDDYPPLDDSNSWEAKHRSTEKVLHRMKPDSVIDLAANTGWFSRLAAGLGARAVAVDQDELAVQRLYADLSGTTEPVTPVIMDLLFPTPGHGIGYRVFPSATDRFRSDIALALALVHHLVFTEGLPFGPIVEMISAFDRGGLVVEFVPPSDAHVIAWGREIPGWYSLETFVSELRRVYRSVEVVPSSPDPRVLLVCSR